MLSDKMLRALNDQINAELYSSYLYLAMAAYFEDKGLPGFAHWMKAQSVEELGHVARLFEFVNDRGGRVTLEAIERPPAEWDSPLAVFEATLKHEVHVTQLISKLVDLAIEERDHATHNFLQWFVAEQVEEEASVNEILQRLKLAAESNHGLFMLDKELASRPITMPVLTGE